MYLFRINLQRTEFLCLRRDMTLLTDDERIAHDLTIAWIVKNGKTGEGSYETVNEYFDFYQSVRGAIDIKRKADAKFNRK